MALSLAHTTAGAHFVDVEATHLCWLHCISDLRDLLGQHLGHPLTSKEACPLSLDLGRPYYNYHTNVKPIWIYNVDYFLLLLKKTTICCCSNM